MMHVVHVVTELDQGGAQRVLLALLGRDRVNRHTVIKLFAGRGLFDDEVARLAEGVHGLGLPRTPAAFLLAPFAVIRLIRRIVALRPTVVVGWLYYGALAASLGRLLRRPVIWSFHAADFDPHTSFRSATRAAIRACRALSGIVPAGIHYCSGAARAHHERLGFPPAKSVVIENGVDVGAIRQRAATSPEQPALARLREAGAPASEAKMVGCVARYNPQKDHRTLLQALAKLKGSGRSFRLALAGLGCESGNPALAALIAEFGLQAEVILLGVSSEVERLIARCDAIVLSSREGEAMPMVLIEALALGRPVVATDVGSVRETVGDYGLLVPPRDSEALAEALDRVLWRDARHWSSVAASAPDDVRERFPLDALASRWDELIRRAGKKPA